MKPGVSVVVLVAGLFLPALVACSDGDPEAPSPGVWVAFAPPDPVLALDSHYRTRIHILNALTGERREIGDPAEYGPVVWSPDGSLIAAATSVRPDDPARDAEHHLVILSVDGRTVWKSAYPASPLAWSPDGSRLALHALDGESVNSVVLVDRQGHEVGRTPFVPRPTRQGGSLPLLGDEPWSPDSQRLALLKDGALLLIDRDGRGAHHELHSAAYEWGFQPLGWRSSVEIAFLQLGPQRQVYRATVGPSATDAITWAGPEPFDLGAEIARFEAQREELNRLDDDRLLMSSRPTADGSATVHVLEQSRIGPDGPRLVVGTSLAVRVVDELTVVDLGGRSRLPGGFDVVVVPGWEGELPREASLAVHPPRDDVHVPRHTLGPGGGGTAPPPTPAPPLAAPVPFPTPRGDRVEPKVPNLPAFPGAVEIDGWTEVVSGFEVAVQLFETDAGPAGVLAFYESALPEAGMAINSKGGSVEGLQADFSRGLARVHVATGFRQRPGEPPLDPPPGYQRPGVPHLPGPDGKTWFIVATLQGH